MDYIPRMITDELLPRLLSAESLDLLLSSVIMSPLFAVVAWLMYRMFTDVDPDPLTIEEYEKRVGRNTRGKPGVL